LSVRGFWGAAVLGIALAAAGAGADLYYLEAEKDGRLYVFADKGVHDRWARGKAIPKPITLRRYGPQGEDVVFDGEAAVNLYNHRHARTAPEPGAPLSEPGSAPAPGPPLPGPPLPGPSLAGPPPPPPGPTPSPQPGAGVPPRVAWDHGTSFTFEDASVYLENRVQFRFTDEFPPDSLQLPGTDAPGASKPSFKIRRAKTSFEGFILWKELTYELQIGWAGSDTGIAQGTTFSGLEDAYLDWDISRRGLFRARGGQFKVPFGRQEYTSSERQQFVDRSILSAEFTLSRDVGVMLWGGTEGNRLVWALGAFNGNQRNRPANDNAALQWNARLTFQPWGDVGYSEADFESKDHPLLAVEGEFQRNDQQAVTNANDFDDRTFGLNGVFKYKGFSAFAEYFWRQRTPETGPEFSSNGYHAQAGYFLWRRNVEVAARYAAWDPTDAQSGNDISEVAGAVNYYVRGHKLKTTGDFRRLRDERRDETFHELRLQVQFVF
jgi:hypothetical protein